MDGVEGVEVGVWEKQKREFGVSFKVDESFFSESLTNKKN